MCEMLGNNVGKYGVKMVAGAPGHSALVVKGEVGA